MLIKNSSTNYDTTWVNYIPTGGTANQILSKVNSTNYNTQWVNNATTYFQTTLPTTTSISSTVVDLLSFTLPVVGTYKITIIARAYINTNATNGLVFLRTSTNSEINDSKMMPHFNSGGDSQAYGTMVHILTTTTANEVYKVSGFAGGGGVMNILSDGNGVSKLIWEKIG